MGDGELKGLLEQVSLIYVHVDESERKEGFWRGVGKYFRSNARLFSPERLMGPSLHELRMLSISRVCEACHTKNSNDKEGDV